MKNNTNEPSVGFARPVTQADRVLFARELRSLHGKWKAEILGALVDRKHRFGELRKAIPGITQHMLTARLRELEAAGLIKRTAYPEIPPRVEYEVTSKTQDLAPICDAFWVWFEQYGRPSSDQRVNRTVIRGQRTA